MLGILLSFVTALSVSARDALAKRSLRHTDDLIVTWSISIFSCLLLPVLLVFAGLPQFGNEFLKAILIGGSLNIAANILYIKALKASDLSLAVPILAFSPALLLLTTPIILKEAPGVQGVFGVLAIVIGSYVLNIKERHNGYFAPFKALLNNKGAQYMFIITFLWSISGNMDKIGIKNSSPVFWAIAMNAFIAIGMTPIVLTKSKKHIPQLITNWKILLPITLVYVVGIVAQNFAMTITYVVYLSAIKKLSILISIFIGYRFFREENIQQRLAGAIIMLVGVLLIAFS